MSLARDARRHELRIFAPRKIIFPEPKCDG